MIARRTSTTKNENIMQVCSAGGPKQSYIDWIQQDYFQYYRDEGHSKLWCKVDKHLKS